MKAPHFILCLVMLAFTLQGATHAGVLTSLESQPQHHCDGHQSAGEDCACCTETLGMSGGCGALCAVGAALPVASMSIPHAICAERQSLVVRGALGPAHIPLNPPPIS